MKQPLICSNDLLRRQGEKDRRTLSFKSFFSSFSIGRRINARRTQELKQGYYTDRYEKWVSWSAIAIVLLSTLDGFFTLNILEKGGTEVNPLMQALLEYDTQVFLLSKLVITVTCVLFCLVHINFHMFRVLSMKIMIKSILAIYLALIGYEIFLLVII
ncbi:MAG: DUF5658 family protein [Methylococcaceae bacterium]